MISFFIDAFILQLAKACANMKSDVGDFDDKNFWNR